MRVISSRTGDRDETDGQEETHPPCARQCVSVSIKALPFHLLKKGDQILSSCEADTHTNSKKRLNSPATIVSRFFFFFFFFCCYFSYISRSQMIISLFFFFSLRSTVNQVLFIFQPQGTTGFDPIHSFRLSRVQNFLFSYLS